MSGPVTVKRKIYFYKAVAVDENGNTVTFSQDDLFASLAGLPPTLEGAAIPWYNQERLTVYPSKEGNLYRLRFARTRTRDLPYAQDGNLALDELTVPAGGGTSELIHVTFYPGDIVGMIYNHGAPRMSALSWFIRERCQSIVGERFEFRPLLRGDALREILSLEKVSSVTFSIETHTADLIGSAKESKSLLDAAADIAKIGQPALIDVSVRGVMDPDAAKAVIRDLATNKVISGGVRQVRVKGGHAEDAKEGKKRKYRMEAIDLLASQMVFETRVVALKENHKTLDDGAAWEAMDAVFFRRKKEIASAAPILE